jgi:hypothetical protein
LQPDWRGDSQWLLSIWLNEANPLVSKKLPCQNVVVDKIEKTQPNLERVSNKDVGHKIVESPVILAPTVVYNRLPRWFEALAPDTRRAYGDLNFFQPIHGGNE